MTAQIVIFEALALPAVVKLVPWGGGTPIVASTVAAASGNRDGFYAAAVTGAVGKYSLHGYDGAGNVTQTDTILMADISDEQFVSSLAGVIDTAQNAAIMTELATVLSGSDGFTLLELLRIGIAVLSGPVSGATLTGGTLTFKSLDSSINRVVANCDSFGNRTGLTFLPG
jgi:hypothetical protein